MGTHLFFIIGAVAWAFGMLLLGLALKLDPALASAPAVTTIIFVLAYMVVKKEGITGVPGITGPPMPARVIMSVVFVFLTINLFVQAAAGAISAADWGKLSLVYVLGIGVSQGLAAKA